ncbi:MAG: M23 family metallopeptidase [Leucobacter sp.]|nr:M23 family metallopeptidase [Leucobacter sp.]
MARGLLTMLSGAALVLSAFTGSSTAASAAAAVQSVTITGTPAVGSLLTANVAPAEGKYKYRWFRDGVPIKGEAAIAAAYTATYEDLGTLLTVRATPRGVYVADGAVFSDAVGPIEVGTFSPLKPKLIGEQKFGTALTVGPLEPSAGTVSVLWLRDGKSTGATGASYTPGIKDLGKRISARVTQSGDGFIKLVETTKQSKIIKSLRYLTAITPKVKGTVKVGAKLRAIVGKAGWTKNTTFTYQWYASGTKIRGATKKSFTVTKAQRGRVVKVKVIGNKKHYETRAVLSAPAKIAGLRGPRNENLWAWPTDTRAVTQGYHEGYALDLGTTKGGPAFAPYSGVVVAVGGDGGGKPSFCPTEWWRGENQTVVIRHKYDGKVVYSALNHLEKGSSKALGITVGTKVRSGQQVATTGMTGCTSGPHLHLVLRKTQWNWWGEIKPQKYIGKPTPPAGTAGAIVRGDLRVLSGHD